ncbi:hypothetical protein I4U23_028720 [Adineta vaga]|nr:hypothetical protein I4U23_028720 [Adineta vaga]
MYTLESRYRPIPEKVLPKQTGSRLYYLNSDNAEQQRASTPPVTKEERDTPVPREPEVLRSVQEPPPTATVFLEPQIVSQPILYCLVGNKNVPVYDVQPASTPVPLHEETSLPILYSITGRVQVPTLETSENPAVVSSEPADKQVILYSVIGDPKSKIILEEPNKLVPVSQEPLRNAPSVSQSTVPSFYLLIGDPHISSKIPEPLKEVPSLSQPTLPILYSIVGRPKIKPPVKELSIVNQPPPTQIMKVDWIEPTPILYTIVGGKHIPTNIPVDTYEPPSPTKKQVNHTMLYTVVGDPKTPQTMSLPQKIQPVKVHKQQPTQQPPSIPTFYPLVGKPHSPTREEMKTQPKPLMRSRIPLPQIGTTRRRSIEPESAPEAEPTDFSPTRQKKPKRQERLKEPTIPKSQTMFIPFADQERPRRQKQPRATPRYMDLGEIDRQTLAIPQYDPLQLPDYISPYAYYPSKPYHERTCHPTSLPIVKPRRSERKERAPLNESSPRSNRKHLSEPWVDHSLERHSTEKTRRPRVWDYENHSHTDVDDDTNEPNTFSRKRTYRGYRIRTPWAPVW